MAIIAAAGGGSGLIRNMQYALRNMHNYYPYHHQHHQNHHQYHHQHLIGWFLYIVISIFSGEGDFNCFTCCKRKAIQPYPSSSSIPSTPSTPHLEHMMTAHQTVNGHLFVPVPSKSTALQHLEQDDEEDYEDDEEVGSPLVSAISVNPLLKIASGSAGNSGGGVVGKGRAPTPTVVDGGNSPSQWVGNWLASPTNLSIEAFLKNSPLPSDMYPYSPTTVKDN